VKKSSENQERIDDIIGGVKEEEFLEGERGVHGDVKKTHALVWYVACVFVDFVRTYFVNRAASSFLSWGEWAESEFVFILEIVKHVFLVL